MGRSALPACIQAQGGCIHDASSDEVAEHPPSKPLAPSLTQPPLTTLPPSLIVQVLGARKPSNGRAPAGTATLNLNPCWTPHALLTTSSAQASCLLMTTYDTTHQRGGYYTVLAVTKHSRCAALCQPQMSAQATHRRCAYEPITGSNMKPTHVHCVCTKATRRFPPNTLGDTASTNSSRWQHTPQHPLSGGAYTLDCAGTAMVMQQQLLRQTVQSHLHPCPGMRHRFHTTPLTALLSCPLCAYHTKHSKLFIPTPHNTHTRQLGEASAWQQLQDGEGWLLYRCHSWPQTLAWPSRHCSQPPAAQRP